MNNSNHNLSQRNIVIPKQAHKHMLHHNKNITILKTDTNTHNNDSQPHNKIITHSKLYTNANTTDFLSYSRDSILPKNYTTTHKTNITHPNNLINQIKTIMNIKIHNAIRRQINIKRQYANHNVFPTK